MPTNSVIRLSVDDLGMLGGNGGVGGVDRANTSRSHFDHPLESSQHP